MFKNEALNEIINKMPLGKEKLELTMLFVLIDGYLNGTLSEKDFLNDIAVVLEVK
jgi:hypothetical protein